MTAPLKVGDRVTMRTGLTPSDGSEPPMLVGTVESWQHGTGQIVRWDDWPCMTALPNPNVRPIPKPAPRRGDKETP